MRDKLSFFSPICIRDNKGSLSSRWITPHERQLFAIGRKSRRRINISNKNLRGSSKDGNLVKHNLPRLSSNKVNMIAVGGKTQTGNPASVRGHDLFITAGGNMSEPKTLLLDWTQHMYNVFAIGRYHRRSRFAVRRQTR